MCPGGAAREAAEDTQRALQAALLSFAGKPVVELVSFDLGAKLTELGLAQYCPAEACLECVAPVCVWLVICCVLAGMASSKRSQRVGNKVKNPCQERGKERVPGCGVAQVCCTCECVYCWRRGV